MVTLSKLRRHGARALLGILVDRTGLTRVGKSLLGRGFDIRHGTTTCGIVRLESLNIESRSKGQGQFYVATPRYEFTHVLRQASIDPREYIFLDQGCGMGVVLLYAIEAGFRKVIGVEFSPDLAAIARENARKFCGDGDGRMEVVTGDATEFRIPLEPCVIFYFNPFSAAIAAATLARAKEAYDAGNCDIYLIWYNVTANAEPLFQADWLQMLADGRNRPGRASFLSASNLRLPYVIFKAKPR